MIDKKTLEPRREVALLIKKILAERNWTQQQLATELPCSEYTISRYLSGKYAPTGAMLERMRRLLRPPLETEPSKELLESCVPFFESTPNNIFSEIPKPIDWFKIPRSLLGAFAHECFAMTSPHAFIHKDILPGDVIFIKKSVVYKDGDIVLCRKGNSYGFTPLSVFFAVDDISVLGVVIAVFKRL